MPDFEAFVEQHPDLYAVLAEDGTVLYCNSTIERACGYAPAAFAGESVLEYVHPDDRSRLESLLRDPDRWSADTAGDYRFRCDDGSWVRLGVVGEPQPHREPDGYGVVFRERRGRDAVERALERYRVILDSLDDAVYAIDSDGTIVYVNEAYASMKGVDRDDLLGTDIYDWGTDGAIERIKAARRERSTTDRGVGVVEFEFSTDDGDRLPVEMRFGTVCQADDELERVGVVRDVSERKARERALRRKNERLEEFASIVSHDLRNPLNVAEGNLALALEECDSEYLDEVAAAHDRMGALIDDLLSLARDGNAVAETRAVDLASTVQRGWRGVDTEAATLVVDTDRTIVADGSRVQQLIENLVRNAVEHGGSDVTVSVGDCEDGFFVEDDGTGIPAERRDSVFEPGYSTASEGTGYGLRIVESVVDAHGWSIAVTDGTDGGARFEITGVEFAE